MKAGITLSISVGLALILILAAIVLPGQSRDKSLFGTWSGDRDWKALNLDSEAVARALAAVDLSLKGDGSFVLKDGGIPFTGSWSQTGTGIDLRVETYMNQAIERQNEAVKKAANFTVRMEGGHMFYKSAGETKEFELKKKAQP